MFGEVPVVISNVLGDKQITGGAFVMDTLEYLIHENLRVSVGTSGADFSEGKLWLRVEAESALALKTPQAFAIYKNNPENTGGWA